MNENRTTEMFESSSVKKEVFQNAIPAMIAMWMVLIYNLADTFLSDRHMMICKSQRYHWQLPYFCCLWQWYLGIPS